MVDNLKPRYSKPRKCIQFNTDELMCLKMLAYCVKKHEPDCRTRIGLWNRVDELCYSVLAGVLRSGTTFKEIQTWVEENRGLTITPDILYQRADKAVRYGEFNHHLRCVEASYLTITHNSNHTNIIESVSQVSSISQVSSTSQVLTVTTVSEIELDSRRDFPNSMVKQKLKEQGGICAYCKCPLDSGGIIGEHYCPHSKGGRTELYNCVVSCVRCNIEKDDMSAFDYGVLHGKRSSRGRKLK